MFPFMYDGYGDDYGDNYGFGYGRHGHRHGHRHHGGIVNNLIVNVRDQYCYDNSGCFIPLP